MRTILFVCTGNTCRSPMAEAIARDWLSRHQAEVGEAFAASAGIAAPEGAPVSPGTLVALKNMGLEHDGWAKLLNAEMIRKADFVLCMEAEHVVAARTLVRGEAEHEAKIVSLDPDADLDDPIGHGQEAYDALGRTLRVLVPRRLTELLLHEDRTGIGSSR